MIISLKKVKKYFPIRSGVFLQISGWVRALEEIDLEICENETVGVVGESGCGKTTLGRVVAKILQPTAGEINFSGVDISKKLPRQIEKTFRRSVQMIFQDPFNSLDPRMTIADVVKEPLEAHNVFSSKKEQEEYIRELLSKVGLHGEYLSRYPHEFSGGQRQRIAIARAIALKPKLIICDEPTSALDISVQSQIINLLQQLREEYKMSYLFISHNLDVVYHMSDRLIVMYLGNVVECGEAREVFENPVHPYTKALMESTPSWNPEEKRLSRIKLSGEPPSPVNPPEGCPFSTRCPVKIERCEKEKPVLLGNNQHKVACFIGEV
ncbi:MULTISPECIES: ABC transporter ATP-binding protein [Pseudothermotoga]|uniref:Oligopeptide/dipeptide ABC transporter, ATPase subunit n=1 Tax=Pseudothermotoga lettingae (strain ATCC BAA-301 / DSM 14385 / NBRC 107922 / TMO) TaxID=416591 RepID=A8F7E9_PSELT|nr:MULTISPECIES: oligopeptide/dipeptide ABC transporter ATP-binding protein [Pseudothermotoga]ABV34083.1 oligopeptide/dipeptide ABC transporter, ATPase subunit [Pseudothermotoga lettingae TMO]MDI3494672.1 peptide/nickel transport system ATP-binding protein [Pseudothermotoga sp.]MDK2884708.1 peptide/nickel transport system ATP-binding protein [Pseudothermotoga sp.]GLI48978.1 oligopeptide transport ATP-binding protein AppF [Pseudothermotoga lettingae TMO]HBJ81824.1 ABC transporter ATP-binding pr